MTSSAALLAERDNHIPSSLPSEVDAIHRVITKEDGTCFVALRSSNDVSTDAPYARAAAAGHRARA